MARILIVEGHVFFAEGLGALLEFHGHTVQLVFDGPAAVDAVTRAAAAEPFDVVTSCLTVPGPIDAYTLAGTLRAMESRPVLVAFTAYTDPVHRQHALAAGFDHYLDKGDTEGLMDIAASAGARPRVPPPPT